MKKEDKRYVESGHLGFDKKTQKFFGVLTAVGMLNEYEKALQQIAAVADWTGEHQLTCTNIAKATLKK
jgi:hypothetical protein